MNASLSDKRGGAAMCLLTPEAGKRKFPRIVLGGAAHTVRLADQLRRLGYDVHTAATTDAAVRLVMKKNPTAILLPADVPGGESGYLTSAKLRSAKPRLKVVLMSATRNDRDARMAKFVGASLVAESAAADEVAKLVV